MIIQTNVNSHSRICSDVEFTNTIESRDANKIWRCKGDKKAREDDITEKLEDEEIEGKFIEPKANQIQKNHSKAYETMELRKRVKLKAAMYNLHDNNKHLDRRWPM